MAQQNIDFGSFPNDPAADPIRAAFQKVQNNFTELYQTTLSTGVTEVVAGVGLAQNRTTGNIAISANISNIRLSTGSSNSLVFGTSSSPTAKTVTTVSSVTPIFIDLAPSITTANANFTGSLYTANFGLSGYVNTSMLPGQTETYDLGSASLKWRDLYLSGNTLTIGAVAIKEVNGNLAIPNVVVSGNVAAGNVSAGTVTGNLVTAVQPNVTSVGTLAQLAVTSNISAGNMSVSGSFVAGTIYGNVVLPPGANLSAPGSNMQIMFNDSGNAAAVPGLSFDKANTLLSIQGNISSGNLITTGNATITGNIGVNKVVATGDVEGANIVTLGVVSTQTGISTGANLAISSITGDGSNVTVVFTTQTSIPFNVGSTVTISGVSPESYNGSWTVGTAAVDRITFVSSLTTSASVAGARIKGSGNTTINGILEVVGNTSIGNITAVNSIIGNIMTLSGNANIANFRITSGGNVVGSIFTATLFSGNGANISFINAANVTGTVSSATTASTSDLANNIRQGSYSNITGVGTLTSLTVDGAFNTGDTSISGYLKMSVNNAVAAGASPTALTKTINVITSTSAGTGVALPSAVVGQVIYVINDVNASIIVYPYAGQYIDRLAQNAGFTIGPYGRMTFIATSTSKYYTITSIYA